MATKVFSFDYDAGANIYVRIFGRTGSEVGQVFDDNDNAFKAAISATTHLVCTEKTLEDGTSKSSYTVSIDLADLNSTLALKDYVIKAYNNATPAATDVAVSDTLAFSVQASQYGEQEIDVTIDGANTSSAGSEVRYIVRLYVNGEMRTLDNADTMTLTVREQGGADLFTSGSTTPVTGQGYFEYDKTTPNFVDDRLYEHEAVITETASGFTFTKYDTQQVFG